MSKTQSPPQDEMQPSPAPPSQVRPSRADHSKSVRDSGDLVLTKPVAGEEAWQSLAQQIRTFRIQQEESQRALALLTREQAVFLTDLDNFVSGQVQAKPQWHGLTVAPQPLGEHPQLPAANHHQPAPAPDIIDSQAITSSTLDECSVDEQEQDVAARSSADIQFGRMTNVDTTYSLVPIELMNNMQTKPLVEVVEPAEIPPLKDGVRAWSKAIAGQVLASRYFEPLMGVIIALNAANIGWMIDKELKGDNVDMHDTLESVFLLIFVLELCLRLYVRGWVSLKVAMNAFDFLIVAFNVLTIIIYPVLKAVGGQDAVQYLQQVMVLRMMRLLRLARAVRLVASFRSLWKLVQGLIHAFGTMVSAMVLMFIIIFIFACFGAEFITKQHLRDPEVGDIVAKQFSSLPKILLTLFQFISMDSIAAFYVPLIERSPGLVIYFLLLLVIVAIALMNLVTALLVEDAISSSQMDEEMQTHYTRERLKQLKPALRELFKSLDQSGFGHLHAKDVMNAIRAGIRIPLDLQEFINPARMLDLFEALDSDHSGDLTEDEFVDGLASVALADVPIETMQILYLLRSLRKELKSSAHACTSHRKVLGGRVSGASRASALTSSTSRLSEKSAHQVRFDLDGATNIAMQQMNTSRSRSGRGTIHPRAEGSPLAGEASQEEEPAAAAAGTRNRSKRGTVAPIGGVRVPTSTASSDDDAKGEDKGSIGEVEQGKGDDKGSIGEDGPDKGDDKGSSGEEDLTM